MESAQKLAFCGPGHSILAGGQFTLSKARRKQKTKPVSTAPAMQSGYDGLCPNPPGALPLDPTAF